MDKVIVAAGILLVLAGLTGLIYGLAINVRGMMARGATDYSFVTAYLIQWGLVLVAGLLMTIAARRK